MHPTVSARAFVARRRARPVGPTLVLAGAILSSVVLASAASSAAVAGDWAYWRGPEQNGVSRETGLPDTWSLEDKTNVRWVSDIGGRSTPIVVNGKVYVNCRNEFDVNDPAQVIHAREQVVCWDANDGNVLWRDEFNVFQTDIPAPRIGWASMVGDSETGNVYLHSVSGLFRCYSGDGKVLWEHSLHEEYGKISGYGGRTQTPIIDEDRVIIGFLAINWGDNKAPPPKHWFYAFDKRTGKLLWTSAPGGRPNDTTYANPIVTVHNGTRMLICGNGDGGVYAINARTGTPIWGFAMSRRALNTSPVIDGQYCYIAHGEDNVDTAEFGRVQCIDISGQGDVTKTHSVWRVDDIKAGYQGMLLKDGVLYVVADTGNLHAFDSKTGKPLWVHNLGTVGKGSPVWADGKIYVTEVNGNIHILQANREVCTTLSHVELKARAIAGYDEIYASPAIADGKVFLLTRDRLICLAKPNVEPKSEPIPPLPEESPVQDQAALVQLVPYEVIAKPGDVIEYELRAYDKNGRFIKNVEVKLEPQADLPAAAADGAKLTIGEVKEGQGGHVLAKHGELTAKARVRVFPPLPWKWDFEGYAEKQVPPTWNNAFLKLQPIDQADSKVLKIFKTPGAPSTYIWLGPPDMRDYTVQADVYAEEEKRQLPNLGVTAMRYNLILKCNNNKLTIQTWPPHTRMEHNVTFKAVPKTWYTVKLRVEVQGDKALVRGKAWKRGDAEPAEWTIQAEDPHPNLTGSPGLYYYNLGQGYIDNILVSKE